MRIITDLSAVQVRQTALQCAVDLHGSADLAEQLDGDRRRGRAVGSVLQLAGIFEAYLVGGTLPAELTAGAASAISAEVARRKAAGRGPR